MTGGERTVLVIGGTGATGSRVARDVAGEGARVRVATRTPDPAVPGQTRFEWSDAASHRAAVIGVDAVYLVAPIGVFDPAPLVQPFLATALDAGVRRVVLLSSSAVPPSAEQPGLGQLHHLVSTMVPEWAVLQPSWFMQNFVHESNLGRDIRRSGLIVSATGEGAVPFIDAEDIAAVAVRALLDDTSPDDGLVLTGPRALTYTEAAEVISAATGTAVVHKSVSAMEKAAHLTAQGVPADFAEFLAGLDVVIRDGGAAEVTDTVATVTGRPARSFDQFVVAHREELTPAI